MYGFRELDESVESRVEKRLHKEFCIAIIALMWKRKCGLGLLRCTFLKPMQTSQRGTHKEILRLVSGST